MITIRFWQEWYDEWCAGFNEFIGYGKTKADALKALSEKLTEKDLSSFYYTESYVLEAFEKRVNEIRDTLGFLCTYDSPAKVLEAINKMEVKMND